MVAVLAVTVVLALWLWKSFPSMIPDESSAEKSGFRSLLPSPSCPGRILAATVHRNSWPTALLRTSLPTFHVFRA